MNFYKFFIVAVLCMLSVFCYGDDVTLGVEIYYEKKDSLTTVQEINAKELEQKNIGQVQALEFVADVTGVVVTGTSNTGRTDPIIRGFGDSCRRISIFTDGKPEKMAMFGCGVSHSLLSANIERIEVVKGPDGVLYGSGALGGVINIITRQPVSPIEYKLDVSAGSFNTLNSAIYIGGVSDNIIYEVSADKASSDGYVENSQYNATGVYEKIGYIFNDKSVLSFSAKQYSGIKHEPGEEYAIKGKGEPYFENYDRGSLLLNYEKSFSQSSLSLKAFSDYGNHKFQDGFHSRDLTIGGYVDYNANIGERDLLKTGAEFIQQEAKLINSSYGKGSWKSSSYALYVLDEHNFNSKLKGVVGARYNEDETVGGTFVPKAGLEYKTGLISSLKALYSRGFRTPYLNELYVVPAKNKNLKTETVDNYEIGFNISGRQLIFDITGFIMKGDNLIVQKENPISLRPPKNTFQNGGAFEFKGSEVSLKYILNKYITSSAGYTYFDAGENTQGRPRDKVDASICFTKNRFSFDIWAMYIGQYYAKDNHEERLDDFCKLNAKITYEINDNAKVFVAGENLTNQKYYMYLDRSDLTEGVFEMPSASVTIGTQIKF